LKLPGQILVPAEYWLGIAVRCSINWPRSTHQDVAPASPSHQSAVQGVYVMVGPAWRDALKVVEPETVLRSRPHRIALICVLLKLDITVLQTMIRNRRQSFEIRDSASPASCSPLRIT
jgi:hypothetical protein